MIARIATATLENDLLKAVEAQNYELAQTQLRNGAKGTAVSADSESVLHIAVRLRDLRMVTLLLRNFADLPVKDKNGRTPVVLASLNEFWDAVILMAGARKEQNDTYGFGNALLWAVRKNHYQAAEALLKAGATTIWIITDTGETVLHAAVANNNPQMVRLLLKNGANPAVKTKNEETPVQMARSKDFWNCVIAFAECCQTDPALKDAFGDIMLSAVNRNRYKAAKALLQAGAVTNWNIVATENRALHEAVRHNNPHMVALLLHYKADKEVKNKNKNSPVELAQEPGFTSCLHAFFEPQHYLIEKESEIHSYLQISLFYLFAAHANSLENLLRDCAKITFTNI